MTFERKPLIGCSQSVAAWEVVKGLMPINLINGI